VIINYHANSDFRLDVCCTCALTPANMANVLILRTYAPPHDTLCSVAPTCTLAFQSFAVYLTPVVRLCLQAIGAFYISMIVPVSWLSSPVESFASVVSSFTPVPIVGV
jgi:hypothetical protein